MKPPYFWMRFPSRSVERRPTTSWFRCLGAMEHVMKVWLRYTIGIPCIYTYTYIIYIHVYIYIYIYVYIYTYIYIYKDIKFKLQLLLECWKMLNGLMLTSISMAMEVSRSIGSKMVLCEKPNSVNRRLHSNPQLCILLGNVLPARRRHRILWIGRHVQGGQIVRRGSIVL